MMSIRIKAVLLALIIGISLLVSGWWFIQLMDTPLEKFDGQRALQDVVTQVAFGPRTPGSEAHDTTIKYIQHELRTAGWHVEILESEWNGHPIKNILAFRGARDTIPEIMLGAHYDSRLSADKGSGNDWTQAVPGANDGASGVAILLELARTLPRDSVPVWLTFFDAEDNGRIGDWDWILGSRAFARDMWLKPNSVVIVDMVGDEDLTLFIEKNSDLVLVNEIWSQAAILGYTQFLSEPKYAILDDHIPFLEMGIPAVDIIDFDYPFHHTLSDTPDKVSADSLEAVGMTLWTWIMSK